MTSDQINRLAPLLAQAGDAAEVASGVLDGDAKTVASIAAAVMRFAADLARAGVDPIEHIERVHAAEPLLAGVEAEWAEVLRTKFGGTP